MSQTQTQTCDSCGEPKAVTETYRAGTAMDMALNVHTPLSQQTLAVCRACEARGAALLGRGW